MEILIVLGVLVVGGGLLFGTKAGQQILNAIGAQWNKAGNAAANADPMATYQKAVDDGVEEIRKAKAKLPGAVALISQVDRQVTEGKTKKSRLEYRIQTALSKGDQATASKYAAELADVESDLKLNEDQLKQHNESYESFAGDVKRQQQKVQQAQQEAQRLGVQLKMSEANKAFAEFESSFSTNAASLSKVREERERVLRKIDENNAYRKVARDVDGPTEADDDEIDRQMKAQEILRRFQGGDTAV